MSTILCLGEGNFSFARALSQLLCSSSPNDENTIINVSNLVVTSYDSYDDLVSKYSDINSILSSLKKDSRVLIRHSIDASMPLANQLDMPSHEFDHIIFNFPHLGIENAVAHSSLLGHFFASAKLSMNSSSIIYLTLTTNQFARWRGAEMASRNGLQLISRLKLQEDVWIGYECKRHHVGKSFRTRIVGDEAFTFCFILSNLDEATAMEVKRNNLFAKIYDMSTMKQAQTSTISDNSDGTIHSLKSRKLNIDIDSDSGSKIACSNTNINSSSSSGNRSGEKYIHLSDDSELAWQCISCDKRFRTKQGVNTHFHMQHELSTNQTNSQQLTEQPLTSTILPCTLCDRTFVCEQAFQQHILSKHTTIIRPSSAITPIESSIPTSSEHITRSALLLPYECISCGQKYATEDGLNDHNISFKPVTKSADLPCHVCGRLFGSARALLQHSAYAHTSTDISLST